MEYGASTLKQHSSSYTNRKVTGTKGSRACQELPLTSCNKSPLKILIGLGIKNELFGRFISPLMCENKTLPQHSSGA